MLAAVHASEVPALSGWKTTAGGTPTVVKEGSRNAAPAATFSPTRNWVKVTPILLPSEASPSWAAAAAKVVGDAVADNSSTKLWKGLVGSVTNPTEYELPPFRGLEWWMLAESVAAPMWRGELNPPAPFAAEKGQVLWHLIDLRSGDGSESVKLSDIVLTQSSADGNVLGDTISMASTSYSTLAVGVRVDGTRAHESGSATNTAQRIVFLAKGIRFNGGGSQAGLTQIRTYVTTRPYAVTMMARVGGRTSSTTSYLNPPALPEVSLALGRLNTNAPVTLRLDGGKVGSTYRLQATGASPIAGPWVDTSTIEAGESLTPSFEGSQMFFRVVPQ